jgi:hypothetical protein
LKALIALLAFSTLAQQALAQSEVDSPLIFSEWDIVLDSEAGVPLTDLIAGAEQGEADSQYVLAQRYFQGLGIQQDYSEALIWLRLSADQGYTRALSAVAPLYYHGEGVPKSFAEAARWYRRAAEQGNATAQYTLGGMFFSGEGVIKDSVTSYMWINISAVSGNQNYIDARNHFESILPAGQVADGQLRARVCFTSDYQDCD